ncbi:MAG: hypothetical protein LBP22_03735 [Deltaproteobacteria bacterium]|nr:hypothetical protein [Deltaproteobacteria bacterium]
MSSCAVRPPNSSCYPPVVHLQSVPEPILHGQTNQDLLVYCLDLLEALRLSNLDKKSLQEWVDSL